MVTQQRVDVIPQRRTRAPQAQLQAADVLDAPLDGARALDHAGPLLDMGEAAAYLRFKGQRAADKCRQFLQRNHISLHRLGRRVLVRRAAIDRFLETGASDVDAQARSAVARLSSRPVTRSKVSRPAPEPKEMVLP